MPEQCIPHSGLYHRQYKRHDGTNYLNITRYRRVAVRASLQRFLTSRIFSSVLFQVNEENLVSVKKEKKKKNSNSILATLAVRFQFLF